MSYRINSVLKQKVANNVLINRIINNMIVYMCIEHITGEFKFKCSSSHAYHY